MTDNAFALSGAGWGRGGVSRVAPVLRLLRQPRDWLYVAFGAALVQRLDWQPDDPTHVSLPAALLLPVTALTIARLAQREWLHRWGGGALLALALVLVAAGGSLSADALHDPLFWGVMAALAAGLSAVIGRWPVAAATAFAGAGACAIVATLLPVFPDFESSFPAVGFDVSRQAFRSLSDQLGVAAAVLLLGLWLQAILVGGRGGSGTARIGAAARGALLAGLLLVAAGAVTQAGLPTGWIVTLGVLLGLAEAKARPPVPRFNWEPLQWYADPAHWHPMAVLLLLELLLALLLLPAPGTGDVPSFWIAWSRTMVTNGLVEGYILNNTDYPPLSAIMLLLVSKAALGWSSTIFLGLKVSLVAALFVSTLCFWRWTRDVPLTALLAFSLFLNGNALGYIDVYFAPTLILSLWALQRKNLPLFSLMYAVTCLIKWQPAIIAPFLLLHAVSIRSSAESSGPSLARRWVAVAAPALAITLILVAIFGFGPIQRSLARALEHTYLSGTALNFNWVVSYFLNVFYPEQYGALTNGMVSYIHVNLQLPWVRLIRLVFAVFFLAALWRLFRSRTSFVAAVECSLIGYLAYFILNVGVHENHLFAGTVLAVAAAALAPEKTMRAVLVVAMSNLNLITFYGITGAPLGYPLVVGIDVSVILAAVNVLLFLVFWADVVSPRHVFTRRKPERVGDSELTLSQSRT